jgi:putative glutamine amidotransferase
MRPPIVGICAALHRFEEGVYATQQLMALNLSYIRAVEQAGGIPLILPIVKSEELQVEQLKQVDALILSGGNDIHPSLYQEQVRPLLGNTTIERDFYELNQAKNALKLALPTLGICRGMQLLNVAFGGSLYQDIPSEYERRAIEHCYLTDPSIPVHYVNLVEGTKIQNIFKKEKILTNTIHHQAIKKIAPGFIVSGYAEDGMIEAFEKEGENFVVGVQWHPEQMVHTDEMKALFSAFTAAAAHKGRHRFARGGDGT